VRSNARRETEPFRSEGSGADGVLMLE